MQPPLPSERLETTQKEDCLWEKVRDDLAKRRFRSKHRDELLKEIRSS